jgi:trehalose 6-phosphate synthase
MAGRFYQVTAPSRSANPDYQYLNKVLAERTEEINQHLEGRPVYHLDSGVPSPENYRFMREVDVMFVTPLEDGMNLVAFEYILSQKFKDPDRRGLLALSTSGASRLLKHKGFGEADGVVTVNPLKAKDAGQGVARAVRAGRRISDRLIEYVEKERRVDDWAQQNIDAILNCRQRI